jgi:hypothetical protein
MMDQSSENNTLYSWNWKFGEGRLDFSGDGDFLFCGVVLGLVWFLLEMGLALKLLLTTFNVWT